MLCCHILGTNEAHGMSCLIKATQKRVSCTRPVVPTPHQRQSLSNYTAIRRLQAKTKECKATHACSMMSSNLLASSLRLGLWSGFTSQQHSIAARHSGSHHSGTYTMQSIASHETKAKLKRHTAPAVLVKAQYACR